MKRRAFSSLTILALLLAPAAHAASSVPFRELDHQHRMPDRDAQVWHAFVTDRAELRRSWERYNLEGDPPRVDFERRVAVLAGTGGSSSCPLYVHDVRLRGADREVIVRVANDVGDANGCTHDWRPSTFVLSISKQHLPSATDLRARVRRIFPN